MCWIINNYVDYMFCFAPANSGLYCTFLFQNIINIISINTALVQYLG